MREPDWIQTFTGKAVHPTRLQPEDVDIEDIAHSLSMQCRFGGHPKLFYSVAEHSVRVSKAVQESGGTVEECKWGLLHDAEETYFPDLTKPLKMMPAFAFYVEYGKAAQKVICGVFGLPEKEPAVVKFADEALLQAEARDVMAPLHEDWRGQKKAHPGKIIRPYAPNEARLFFLSRYHELFETKTR